MIPENIVPDVSVPVGAEANLTGIFVDRPGHRRHVIEIYIAQVAIQLHIVSAPI